MDDLNSRKAAIDAPWKALYEDNPNIIRQAAIDALYKALYEHEDKNVNLSSVQPEWIKMSDADGEYWACNVCGEALPRITDFDPQFDLFPRLKSIDRTNFCPNCGAPMHMRERRK